MVGQRDYEEEEKLQLEANCYADEINELKGQLEDAIHQRDMRIKLLEDANRLEADERKRLERAIIYMAKLNAGEGGI